MRYLVGKKYLKAKKPKKDQTKTKTIKKVSNIKGKHLIGGYRSSMRVLNKRRKAILTNFQDPQTLPVNVINRL